MMRDIPPFDSTNPERQKLSLWIWFAFVLLTVLGLIVPRLSLFHSSPVPHKSNALVERIKAESAVVKPWAVLDGDIRAFSLSIANRRNGVKNQALTAFNASAKAQKSLDDWILQHKPTSVQEVRTNAASLWTIAHTTEVEYQQVKTRLASLDDKELTAIGRKVRQALVSGGKVDFTLESLREQFEKIKSAAEGRVPEQQGETEQKLIEHVSRQVKGR